MKHNLGCGDGRSVAWGMGTKGWLPRASPFRALAQTCPKCGVLRTTPDDRLHRGDGRKTPCCRECLKARHRRHIHTRDDAVTRRSRLRLQSETLEKASRRGATWTTREEDLLDDPSLSNQEIARRTGRTLWAVQNRRTARRAGELSPGRGEPRTPWTSAELSVAARADLTALEVASLLGRSVAAVKSARSRMKVDARVARLAELPLGDRAAPGTINLAYSAGAERGVPGEI